jgi:hypothetical protein
VTEQEGTSPLSEVSAPLPPLPARGAVIVAREAIHAHAADAARRGLPRPAQLVRGNIHADHAATHINVDIQLGLRR